MNATGAGAGRAVVIYTSDDCHWCGKAKLYLTTRGVAYTERNVEQDAAAAEDAQRLSGQRGTPVITVGDHVIVGFQRRALDKSLALGALDAQAEAALPPAQDTLATILRAGKLPWTAEQQATAAAFARVVDRAALCGFLGQRLDYSPANCDHTFRYVRAYLGDHPPESGADAALAMLLSLGVECDCGYAMNLCS